ncbi:MAG: hypothetical protein WBC33_02255 [Conexibacter sp.]
MARRDAIRRATAATAAVVALTLVAGCGSGERQDAGEASARYPISIVHASFPARQELAKRTQMRIVVKNLGDDTIPNLAVSIGVAGGGTDVAAFGRLDESAGLASRSRPVWVVDEGPGNGETAYANTWAVGPLRPHRTATLTWQVAAVRAGHYELTYRLAGSLTGRSQLRLKDGGIPRDTFEVDVDRTPRQVRVTPDGRIVSEPAK